MDGGWRGGGLGGGREAGRRRRRGRGGVALDDGLFGGEVSGFRGCG